MRISKVILSLIFLTLPALCPAHRLRAVSFEPAADILHGKLLRKDANGVADLRDTGSRGTLIDITYRPVGADVRLIRDGQTRASLHRYGLAL